MILFSVIESLDWRFTTEAKNRPHRSQGDTQFQGSEPEGGRCGLCKIAYTFLRVEQLSAPG